MGRIIAVRVDHDRCLCHELCLGSYSEVFELRNSVATVKDGAEVLFATLDARIRMAADDCPMHAIKIEESQGTP